METWAVVVEARPAPPTPAPPRTSRRPGWFVIAAFLAVTAVLGWLLVLRPDGVQLAAVDRASGAQAALPVVWSAHDQVGGDFRIDLPTAPIAVPADMPPAPDGSASLCTIRLGPAGAALLLVRFGDGTADSPQDALRQMAARTKGMLTATGAIRRTAVGRDTAWARDFQMTSGLQLREFRFTHRGALFGAGILRPANDVAALDTGLAALTTFQWVT